MKGRHPSLDVWLRWLEDPSSVEDPDALRQHRAHCARCGAEADLFERVSRARQVANWELPPASSRRRARRFPGAIATPPPPAALRAVSWLPADVRADGEDAAASRSLSQILDQAEVSLLAVPPEGDGSWRIEGRVWLRTASTEPIALVLRQDDHVLARSSTSDGEFFELEDVVGPGWTLEIHLPSGEVLSMEDPAA